MAHMLPVELLPNYLVNERFIASRIIWHLRSAGIEWPLHMSLEHNGNCRNSRMWYCAVCVYISGLLTLSSDKYNGKFPPVQTEK